MNQLQAERDSAKQDAALAQQQAAADRSEDERQMRSVRSYIDFESAAYARLDRVDSHVTALEGSLAHATGARRATLEKSLRGIAVSEAKVQRDLRRTHKVMDADWAAFQRDIGTTLDTIDSDLQQAEALLATPK